MKEFEIKLGKHTLQDYLQPKPHRRRLGVSLARTGECVIKLVVPTDNKNAKLVITDIAGRTIKLVDVTENTEVKLNTTEYSKGVYLCTFKSNNTIIDKVKLVIIK